MSSTPRTVPVEKSAPRAALAVPRLPLELYRGIAAAMIVLMLLIAALAPLGSAAPTAVRLLPTAFDAQASGELSGRLFNYVDDSQRQQPIPPGRQTLLRETGWTPYARLEIVAEMMIESSAPDANATTAAAVHPLRDAALGGGVERWDSMQTFYEQSNEPWTINGLGAVAAMRSTAASGDEQRTLEQNAADSFAASTLVGSSQWAYSYNWGLAEMLRGNYQQAVVLLERSNAVDPSHPEIGYHLGLAQLRLGQPDEAIATWSKLVALPSSDWTVVANEGIGDALAASGDGSAAVKRWLEIQQVESSLDWGLYEKIERMQLLRGADSLLDTLTGFAQRFPDQPRVHYDRGRVLMMLGRYGEADGELRRAAELRPDEPAIYLGRAQLALAAGKPDDAQAQANSALSKAGLDPNAPSLDLVYARITNPNRYQQSFAQQILEAVLAKAAAWHDQHNHEAAMALAKSVLDQGGSEPAKAAWYRYYAGLIYSAGGMYSDAQSIFRDGLKAPAGTGPGRGALALALVRAIDPAEINIDYDELQRTVSGAAAGQPSAAADVSAAYAYYELAQHLESVGRTQQAGPLYRAAAAWEAGERINLKQPPLSANGLVSPVELEAAEGDYLLRTAQYELAEARYQQLLNVEPSAAGAHTNRGIAFYRQGKELLARREFELATRLDTGNTLAQHNLGVLALREGVTSLPQALGAFGAARSTGGPDALRLGDDLLQAPQAVSLPNPAPTPDFWSRVPALLALLLLLLHTLIFTRRQSDEANAGSPLSALGEMLASRLPAWSLRVTLIVAIVVAGIAWGVASAGLQSGVWALISFALLGIVVAAITIGAQEAAQMYAVRRERNPGSLIERVWPLGLLFAVVGAPFGLLYGWTIASRAARPGQPESEAPVAPVVEAAAPTAKRGTSKRIAQPVGATTAAANAERLPWRNWGALGPAARVAAAGLLANLALAVLFGVLYGFFGNPLWRMLLVANVAVLAFTAVSEPQAEGWQLWRRSPLAWLLLFMVAATALTLLLLRVI